jgi:hypothetical protein
MEFAARAPRREHRGGDGNNGIWALRSTRWSSLWLLVAADLRPETRYDQVEALGGYE